MWQRCVCVSCSAVSDFLQRHGLLPARLLCPQDSPGKNTGVDCHSLLHKIFLTQGPNSGLLHCRQILYYVSYWEVQIWQRWLWQNYWTQSASDRKFHYGKKFSAKIFIAFEQKWSIKKCLCNTVEIQCYVFYKCCYR